MLPTRIPRAWPRPVEELEVITPDGRVFQIPRPSLPRRLFMFSGGTPTRPRSPLRFSC